MVEWTVRASKGDPGKLDDVLLEVSVLRWITGSLWLIVGVTGSNSCPSSREVAEQALGR
jgi:hypothetical protein